MIKKVPIANTTVVNAVGIIKQTIYDHRKGYVCVSNMRTVTYANKNEKYLDVMKRSLFNTPDGIPLVWCGKAWGLKGIERVCGPDLFIKILSDSDSAMKHFLLGDTEETLRRLTEKSNIDFHSNVVGAYSPPFLPLEYYDIPSIAKMINDSGASIVWTSLRAPKQDFLNALLLPLINDGVVLIGVGAAFRVYLGDYVLNKGFWSKMGLGGLNRGNNIWSEFKWYVAHSLALFSFLTDILWKRLRGKKYYE